MTIKNAIEWLKCDKKLCYDPGSEEERFPNIRAEQIAKAIDMAIEALERTEEGEWVLSNPDACVHTSHCSSCGWEETFPPLYCPGCGRKMKNPMRTSQEDEFKFALEFEEIGNSDEEEDEDRAFVEALNTLLEEAVKDGGDAGGAYHQNLDELKDATDTTLRKVYLDDKYEAIIEEDVTKWSWVKVISRSGHH